MTQRKTGWGAVLAGAMGLAACGGGDAAERAGTADTTAAADTTPGAAIALTVDSLDAPEAARFDPDLGVYFVSNVNGGPLAKDGNGYISRLTRDGSVDSLKFISRARGCSRSSEMPVASVNTASWLPWSGVSVKTSTRT